MPSYWTPKQERQYGHIKQSCIQRKCRTVRGKKQCVRTCARMAAATTNKFRNQGMRGLGKDPYWQTHPTIPSPPNVTSPCRYLYCTAPALPGATRCARHSHTQYPKHPPSHRQGVGNVRGKCCVLRGKKRIACFHSKKDAVVLKRSLKKTSGLRIRCV
jgi:hypothetical protein